jgi:hypothetical protein
MTKSEYIKKRVICEGRNKGTWTYVDYECATRWNKEIGCIVYEMTPLGFNHFLFCLRSMGISLPLVADFPLSVSYNSPWGRASSRSDIFNVERIKQGVTVLFRQAGIAAPGDQRVKTPTPRSRGEAQITEICEALSSQVEKLSSLPIETIFETPQFFLKNELSSGKNADKDNLVGAIFTKSQVIAVYHTVSANGTRWISKIKNETLLMLRNAAAITGFGSAEISSAMMVISKDSEFLNIIRSSHGVDVRTRRSFSDSGSSNYANIAKPYKRLYAVFENQEAAAQICEILASPDEDTYATLAKTQIEAQFPKFRIVVHEEVEKMSLTDFPTDTVERYAFTDTFKVFAVNDAVNQAIPVFLGYEMDLVKISKLYYWLYETEYIGEISITGEAKRNVLIACYDWQKKYYRKLFSNIIFSI